MQNRKELNLRKELSKFKLTSGYLRTKPDGKKETWNEAVERVMNMHRTKYSKQIKKNPILNDLINEAEQAYKEELVLGSQRGLQFGGEQVFKHNIRLYNCATTYIDRIESFRETLYVLLCGAGVGASVQFQHVNKLPVFHKRGIRTKTYIIDDSIEGWADALGVLLSSYSKTDDKFSEYYGCNIRFDYSRIRPKGAFISGGFNAPGPDGLKKSLEKIELLLESKFNTKIEEYRLKPIDCYDIIAHSSDAVLSGGVRRSALIMLFSKTDNEMLTAKTGDWFSKNPQRARSNNSVALLKSELTQAELDSYIELIKQFGEPGFVLLDDLEFLFNPCVEAAQRPKIVLNKEELTKFDYSRILTKEHKKVIESDYNVELSGWQFCNLNEINGGKCDTEEIFYRACRNAAILGTLQAGYTDFSRYLTDIAELITEREALLGVSITGMCSNPKVLFNPEVQRKGALIVKETNIMMAQLLGIMPAARTTNIKPSGNSSVVLACPSGIHGDHDDLFFRNVQVNKEEFLGQMLKAVNPLMFEDSVWSAGKTDWVVSFPVIAKEGSLFKQDLIGVKQLELVKLTQQNWVEYGSNDDATVDIKLRHNVSNTIQVNDWNEVSRYIYENKTYLAGISLLSSSGDKDYAQAPFTSIYTPKKMFKEYGDAVMFASGLIVDALDAFNNNLWLACDTTLGFGEKLEFTNEEVLKEIEKLPIQTLWENLGMKGKALKVLLKSEEKPSPDEYKEYMNDLLRDEVYNYSKKKDLVRRIKKFAKNYFNNDFKRATYCLKDVQNYHRYVKIINSYEELNYEELYWPEAFIDADTLASAGCVGNACEI